MRPLSPSGREASSLNDSVECRFGELSVLLVWIVTDDPGDEASLHAPRLDPLPVPPPRGEGEGTKADARVFTLARRYLGSGAAVEGGDQADEAGTGHLWQHGATLEQAYGQGGITEQRE